ncbi:hypothetical protein LINPERHAP1_LOCUS1891 [Linum perenne]
MLEEGPINPRCPRIRFSEEEITNFYKPWSRALVVRILERSFAYPLVKRRLEFLWAKGGRIQVSDLTNDFFLVRFSDVEDYNRAAFQGPWKMAVTRIGNHIGKTVRLDLATKEGARARYARVCVEVDISKPLLGKYMIGDRVYYVEYECLENLCYTCGMYGHKADSCSTTADSPLMDSSKEPASPTEDTKEPENDTGSWMTVSRRSRGKSNKERPNGKSVEKAVTKSMDGSGSRFIVLKQGNNSGQEAKSSQIGKQMESTIANGAQGDSVMSMVALTEELFANSKAKAPIPQTQPLSDITNKDLRLGAPKSGEGRTTELDPESLVSVPISFVNPIFESSSAGQPGGIAFRGVKEKGKLTRGNKPKQEAKIAKDKPKLKNYVSRGVQNQVPKPTGISSGAGSGGGRPPDHSQ